MTFLHKLAKRLARLKVALIMGAVATIACEVPLADPSGSVFRLELSPKISTLRTGQTTQFVVVGLTPTGDTVKFGVRWSATAGNIVDTSTTGGKHFVSYRSPTQPGRYSIISQGMLAGLIDSAVVNVTAVPVTAVSMSPASANTMVGQTVQLAATPLDSVGAALGGRAVTWVSNNSAVATVSGSGLVTGVAAGSTTMTATSEGKSGATAVTVTPVPVASVSVSPAPVGLAIGQTVQLTGTPQDVNGNALAGRVVTWGSSNPGVATVSGSGLVISVAAGLAIMTATSEGKAGTAAITVTPTAAPVASVTVTPASANVTAGQTVQFAATMRDAGGNVLVGRVVTWGSSNTGLATVSGSGLVTGVAAGAATITATSEGQSNSSAINVIAPVASVSVSPTSTSVTAGQNVQLTATPRDASGNALTGRVVTWGSNRTGVATVNGNGRVTGVGAGSATITATSEGRSGTAAVTVTPAPVASVSVSPATASLGTGQSLQLAATPRDASGTALAGRVVTWGSSNPGVATVNGSGLVISIAVGVAIITATSEGQSGTAAVTVTASPPPDTTWPNEPAGWTVLSDYSADATNAGGWINSGGVTVVSDPTAPRSPSSVWQFAFPNGFTGGVSPGMEWRSLPSVSAIYVGFWWKPSNPWQNHSSNVNKLFLVMDDMHPNFGSYWIRMLGPAPYHTYCQFEYDQPTVNYDENVDRTPITLGQWHQVEFLLNRNGGILKWWMDGKLKGSYSGVHFAGSAFGTEAHLQPIWGGIGETKNETDYFWFDHVHLSTP